VKTQIVQEGLLNKNSISSLQVTSQTPDNPDYPGEQIVQVSLRYQFTFLGPWKLLPGLTNPYNMPTVTSSEATR
jgi:hypothetical protein